MAYVLREEEGGRRRVGVPAREASAQRHWERSGRPVPWTWTASVALSCAGSRRGGPVRRSAEGSGGETNRKRTTGGSSGVRGLKKKHAPAAAECVLFSLQPECDCSVNG